MAQFYIIVMYDFQKPIGSQHTNRLIRSVRRGDRYCAYIYIGTIYTSTDLRDIPKNKISWAAFN